MVFFLALTVCVCQNDDGTMGFTTLEDTSLAMYQVFMGAGWGDIMDEAVDATNKAVIWFFFTYVLIVGVLFSNLFVGILISTFQYGEEMQGSDKGEVLLTMYTKCVPYMTPEHIDELIPTLGHVAQGLHFPMSRFRTPEEIAKWSFSSNVDKHDSIEDWAASTIAFAFRKAVAVKRLQRTLKKLRMIKLVTDLDPANAILHAYDRAGLEIEDLISDSSLLLEMVKHVADLSNLTKEESGNKENLWRENDNGKYVAAFESRMDGFTPFQDRMQSFSRQQRREYRGLPKPEDNPISYHNFVLLVVEEIYDTRMYVNYAKKGWFTKPKQPIKPKPIAI